MAYKIKTPRFSRVQKSGEHSFSWLTEAVIIVI